jgi:hypothetical protein
MKQATDTSEDNKNTPLLEAHQIALYESLARSRATAHTLRTEFGLSNDSGVITPIACSENVWLWLNISVTEDQARAIIQAVMDQGININ